MDSLLEELNSENKYLLVDSILIKEELKLWLKNKDSIKIINLFENTIHSHIDLFSSPLIIDITNVDIVDVEKLILSIPNSRQCLTIFSIKIELSKILNKFKFMMFPTVKGKVIFFRFYDPIYFSKLNFIFNDEFVFKNFRYIYCLIDELNSYESKLKLVKVL